MSDNIHEIPKRIHIQRIVDYHTHFCGSRRQNGNLFLGVMTYALIKDDSPLGGRTGHLDVVFEFSPNGKFLRLLKMESTIDASTSLANLNELVDTLGPVDFHDIEVDLFETYVDGIQFGLIPNPESGFINLQPGSLISFYPPWDGDYYT